MCNSSPGSCDILTTVLVCLSQQSFACTPPQDFFVTFNLMDVCPSKRKKVHCKSESQFNLLIMTKVVKKMSPSPGLVLQETGLLLQTRRGKSTPKPTQLLRREKPLILHITFSGCDMPQTCRQETSSGGTRTLPTPRKG